MNCASIWASLSDVWDERPSLRTGAQRRAFLTDPSHKHVVHFTPKHGSWMNQIEIWFGVLSRQLLRRGEFRSVAELTERILDYIAYYNRHQAHPYEWTYTGKPLVSDDQTQATALSIPSQASDDHATSLNRRTCETRY